MVSFLAENRDYMSMGKAKTIAITETQRLQLDLIKEVPYEPNNITIGRVLAYYLKKHPDIKKVKSVQGN